MRYITRAHRITVNIPEAMYRKIDRVAKEEHMSKSKVILYKLMTTKGIPRKKLDEVKVQSLYAQNSLSDVKAILLPLMVKKYYSNSEEEQKLQNATVILKNIERKMEKL